MPVKHANPPRRIVSLALIPLSVLAVVITLVLALDGAADARVMKYTARIDSQALSYYRKHRTPSPSPSPTSSSPSSSSPAPSPSSSSSTTSSPAPSPTSSSVTSSSPAPAPSSSSSTTSSPAPSPSTSSTTTSPSPTPTPTSSSPAPLPMWTGNYNNGTLSQFDSTSWNNLPMAPAAVPSPAYEGSYAGKYTIPAGGQRCENVPSMREMTEGDDMWFSWSTMLGSDFPVNISNWQVIDQWKNDGTGSPPLELTVENGQFRVDGGYGWPGNTSTGTPKMAYKWVGAATNNVWDRWTFHVRFSSDPNVGYVDVWRNGTQVISGWHMPGGTLYPGLNSYLKVGYYRDSAISTQGTVYQDAWKAGTTAASVS